MNGVGESWDFGGKRGWRVVLRVQIFEISVFLLLDMLECLVRIFCVTRWCVRRDGVQISMSRFQDSGLLYGKRESDEELDLVRK